MNNETVVTFLTWLLENTGLHESSAKRYVGGVKSISEYMQTEGVIKKPIDEYDATELAIAIFIIFKNEKFIRKNEATNRMYANALRHFQAFKKSTEIMPQENAVVKEIEENQKLSVTEKEAIIKARVGQGIFRSNILKKYEEKCIITKISDKRLLVASHIKPWAVSNNDERIDSENGLLLNCLYDKLFDLGLITFSIDGKILISKSLSAYDTEIIQIDKEKKYDFKFSEKLSKNIEYHRDVIFLK